MNKLTYPDKRSKRFVFIPFCLICQAFQARGIVRFGYSSTIRPVIEEILKHDVNIIQMPCPESQLGGCENGLKRDPKSLANYNTPEFLSLCEKLADQVIIQIKAIIKNDFEIKAILGIEFSPSCSISLQYSNKGMFHKPGHFIVALKKKLKKEEIEIPFIAINRRGIKSSIKKVNDILERKLL